MKERFNLTTFIVMLNTRVKDIQHYLASESRTLLIGQINSLPNSMKELKDKLIEEFQLQCDMFDHGFRCSSQNI